MMKYNARTLSFGRRLLLIVAGSVAFAGPVLIVAQTPAPPAAAAAPAPAGEAHARGDMSGTWQGTLEAEKSLRLILQVSKTEKGWSGKMYSIDQGSFSMNTSSMMLDGSMFKYAIDMIGGSYQGTLSADGNSIVGTWTQGAKPLPLTFVRATKETAWEIPAPPPPPKLMAADADPSFDVVTIKPNDSGATSIQGLNVRGRNFTTRASSVDDLIKFAYGVHVRQIIGGPEWMDKDRYDINGVPDKDGTPNSTQLQTMMKKLLADRFKLTFHHEKRDLSAFVLTVGKDGQKLTPTPTERSGPLPGLGFGPAPGGLRLNVMNGTMGDFTDFLQMLVLDRPVVDRTGIKGRYDFHFAFTPDDSLFNGHPPRMPAPADGTAVEAAPGFFEAIQKDIGLKLDAQKTAVDVIVIDHVEKPSAN